MRCAVNIRVSTDKEEQKASLGNQRDLFVRIDINAVGSPRIYYRFSNYSAYSLINSINAQHSTCVVCGNMSTGCTSTVL